MPLGSQPYRGPNGFPLQEFGPVLACFRQIGGSRNDNLPADETYQSGGGRVKVMAQATASDGSTVKDCATIYGKRCKGRLRKKSRVASSPKRSQGSLENFLAAPAKFETEIKCRNPHDMARTRPSPVPREVQIGPKSRDFQRSSRRISESADWVAERGGFEPPVPPEFIRAKFSPRLAHNSSSNRHIRARENLFAWNSALIGSLRFSFFGIADAWNPATLMLTTARVRSKLLPGRRAVNNSTLL